MAYKLIPELYQKLDPSLFANMISYREATIQAAPAKEVTADYPINQLAKAMHPDVITLVVADIIDHPGAASKTYVFNAEDGGPLPYFRAGQYISLKMQIGDSFLSRPYSLNSSPKEALAGKYEITIRTNPTGFAADYLLANVKVGDKFRSSSPQGFFYYEDLRDPYNIIGLAGGSGITPFLSMARAIAEGTEDFNLTIIFGSRTEEQILFKDEFDELAKCDKIKVIHVLSDEEKEGYEHGFISADLVKKYMDGDCSIFACGPEAFYKFLEKELPKLGLERKNVRYEAKPITKKVEEDQDFPDASKGQTYKVTVKQGPNEYVIDAVCNEPLLVAMERAGIKAPSRCRSGECGWCRSKVTGGFFFVPEVSDFRRWADKKHRYIHPCCTFPCSDMVIEVPFEYL
ncbi:MAG: 2Fe-2S iron-sulfur cluster binding domain-containing protein [Mogibacterium sp.]|nr:2Fe-2S iron-sulfur cluster binding domain-containing protein [Mogibacterium sp.]